MTVVENEQIDMICSRHGTHRFSLCHVDGGGLGRADERPWDENLDGMKRSSLVNDSQHSRFRFRFRIPGRGACVSCHCCVSVFMFLVPAGPFGEFFMIPGLPSK